jgi:hypothetical protein
VLLNIQRGANRVPEGLSEGGSHQGTRFGTSAPFSFLFRTAGLVCTMRFSTGGCVPPSAARYFSQLPRAAFNDFNGFFGNEVDQESESGD